MASSPRNFESRPPENEQFRQLINALTPVMNWHPEYFGMDRIAEILKDLDTLKSKLDAGDLSPPNRPLRVNIYEGADESLVMELYAFLNDIVRKGSAGYEELVNEINELYKNSNCFEEGSSYTELVSHEILVGDKMALTVNNSPSGITMKLGENIYSVFRLGDINKPADRMPKDLAVDILVADIET
jgi:hypothetical protein